LYYLRARYYDPGVGRFLSRDSFAGDESNPLSLHKYLYTHANPVNLTDPSGLWTLIEIQNVIVNQVNQHRERLVRFEKAIEKAKDVLATSAKIAGGIISAVAVVEAFTNPGRPIKWFGPLFAKGVWNTTRVASDMIGAKPTRFDLGAASFDCFTNRNGAWAHVNHFKNQFRRGIGAGANPAVVDLCARFFSDGVPLPVPAEGVSGRPSMMGVMVHEFTHITLGTEDSAYQCSPIASLGVRNVNIGIGGVVALAASNSAGTNNADNYRCFVRDSWIGGGQKLLENLLRGR
jgi:hypothetical protein